MKKYLQSSIFTCHHNPSSKKLPAEDDVEQSMANRGGNIYFYLSCDLDLPVRVKM